MSRHVVIVGGGITGLAALEQISRVAPGARITLLEVSARLGGHIQTERHAGFVMEAGPDVILTAKPAALELAARVGLASRVQSTSGGAKGSYILSKGELVRMPEGMSGLVPSRLGPFVTTPLVSLRGKARVALDYFIAPRRSREDESIERFVVRRLGREMYEHVVEPLLSGISAGDGASLSIDAMFPRLRGLERQHGGLIRGVLASKRARGTAPPAGSGFASFPLGLHELIEAIQRVVRNRARHGQRISVRTNAHAKSIARVGARSEQSSGRRLAITLADGESLIADAVIVATPAYVASTLLRGLDAELGDALDAVEYASTITISLAYPRNAVRRELDATGYVVPRIEKRPVLACTFTSAKFDGRAPADCELFRLFLGGVGREYVETLTDAELLDIARAELRNVLGIEAPPLLTRINRFDRAMPQYTIGHNARIARILAAASRIPGLEMAGAIYTGLGIPDCVRSGVDAADRAVAALPSGTPTLSALST